MRKNRKYSKAECLSYLEEYMCSSQNHSEFEREKGLKRTTISRWLRIFGIEDKPSPIMSKKLSQTEQELHDRIHELERKIKSLEVELKQSNMARDAYDCMIDLAEKTYNIPVRKNSDCQVIRGLSQGGRRYKCVRFADCLAYQHRDTTSMTMPQTRLTYSLPALYCTACTSARRNVFPKRAAGNSTHSAVNTSGKSLP